MKRDKLPHALVLLAAFGKLPFSAACIALAEKSFLFDP